MRGKYLLALILCVLMFVYGHPLKADDGKDKEKTEPYFHYGKPTSFIEIHGFINFEFFSYGKDGKRGGISSFDLHHTYLIFSSQIREDLYALFEFEIEHGAEEMRFDRMFVEYAPSPYFIVRVGQDYSPFGVEIRHYHAPSRILQSRPFITEMLFDEWREVGIEWIGNISLGPGQFRWETMLANGPSGVTKAGRQKQDTNNGKTFIGRLSYNYFWGEDAFLRIGASFVPSFAYRDNLKMSFTGADFRLHTRHLDIHAEYVRQTADILFGAFKAENVIDFSGPVLFDQKGWTYYILSAYRFFPEWKGFYFVQFGVRYDEIRSDIHRQYHRRWTLSIAYSPIEHVLIRGDYMWIRETRGIELDNDGILVGCVIDF